MTITFSQMGFLAAVTEASATPSVDGYFGQYQGLPYGIHPTATPDAYAALLVAIAANAVEVTAYVAPAAPTLVQVRSTQAATLYAACQAAITGGFSSAALGTAYTYPSTITDQSNQAAIAQSPAGGLLYCQDSKGNWALVEHTQAQAQQVICSFASWLNECQSKLATLISQANSPAATVSTVQALTWS